MLQFTHLGESELPDICADGSGDPEVCAALHNDIEMDPDYVGKPLTTGTFLDPDAWGHAPAVIATKSFFATHKTLLIVLGLAAVVGVGYYVSQKPAFQTP